MKAPAARRWWAGVPALRRENLAGVGLDAPRQHCPQSAKRFIMEDTARVIETLLRRLTDSALASVIAGPGVAEMVSTSPAPFVKAEMIILE